MNTGFYQHWHLDELSPFQDPLPSGQDSAAEHFHLCAAAGKQQKMLLQSQHCSLSFSPGLSASMIAEVYKYKEVFHSVMGSWKNKPVINHDFLVLNVAA